MLFEEAPPTTPPTLLEEPRPDQFTIAQLHSLFQQFSAIAPKGFMLSHAFVDTVVGFADKTVSSVPGGLVWGRLQEVFPQHAYTHYPMHSLTAHALQETLYCTNELACACVPVPVC